MCGADHMAADFSMPALAQAAAKHFLIVLIGSSFGLVNNQETLLYDP